MLTDDKVYQAFLEELQQIEKFRSSNISSILVPTSPVAPTTATFMS